MAQRLSEQVVEWLTAGGNGFTPQTTVPLHVQGRTILGVVDDTNNRSNLNGVDKKNSNHVTINGHVVINPYYNPDSSYTQGIRINRDASGWSLIMFGGLNKSTSGTSLGTWLVGSKSTPEDQGSAPTNSVFRIRRNGDQLSMSEPSLEINNSGTSFGLGIGVQNTSGSTGYGLSLYGGANKGAPQYGTFYGSTSTFGKFGNLTGETAVYHTMDTTANNGWIFETKSIDATPVYTPVIAINNNGSINTAVPANNYLKGLQGIEVGLNLTDSVVGHHTIARALSENGAFTLNQNIKGFNIEYAPSSYYDASGATDRVPDYVVSLMDQVGDSQFRKIKIATENNADGSAIIWPDGKTTAQTTSIGLWSNQLKTWLSAPAASTTNMSSQLIVSSVDDADGDGGKVGIELWSGKNKSWQLLNDDGILNLRHNYTTAKQNTYQDTGRITISYNTGNVRLYSTQDSAYASDTGALQVDGGASFTKKVYINDGTDSNYATLAGSFVTRGGAYITKKVYIADQTDSAYDKTGSFVTEGGGYFGKKVYLANTTDSNYATKAGALVVEGGANFAKKVYLRDATDSNYATVAGSLVTAGGAYITKKLYVASTVDSNYATLAGSIVTAGGLYVTKKTYIADTTDSNYGTLAGALVVAGGANFGKKVYLKDATDSSSYTTGSLVTAGGVAITKQLRVQGVTTHGGNVVSDTNATDNIGVTATRWKEGYFSNLLNVGAASTSYNTTSSHNSYISPGSFYSNVHSADGGFFVYLDNVEYGRLYIQTKGTAPTAATNKKTGETTYSGYAQGYTQLTLGNSKVGANSASGVINNSRGRIRIYGASSTYTDLLSNPNGSKTVYLPYGNTTMYLAWTSAANTAEGTQYKPVYAAAGGELTAITYELKATVNSGTANRLTYYSGANAISAHGSLITDTEVTYNSRTLTPTLRVNSILYADSRIETGGYFMNNSASGGNNTGYYLYGANANYGRFYINKIGTTATDGVGETYLMLGNGTASGTANNARGFLRLYHTNTHYSQFSATTWYSDNINTFYIRGPVSTTNGTDTQTYLVLGNEYATASTNSHNRGILRIYGSGTKRLDINPGLLTSDITLGGVDEHFTMSNSLHFPDKGRGVFLKDSAGVEYGAIYDNGSNLWIGTMSSGNTVHTGGLYFHAGKDSSGNINQTIYIYARGSSATAHASYAMAYGASGSGTQPVYVTSTGKVANTTYSLSATVNSGTSTALAYYSGANAISSEPRIRQHRSNRYPLDLTLHTDAAQVAEFWYDTGDTTNITTGSWRFREYSPNSTANTATTGYYENYFLPKVTTGRTDNANYNILTTKSHAAPNQGTASRIAYYSAAETISSGSLVTDGAYLSTAGVGSSWIDGRSNARFRVTSLSGYTPWFSGKTKNGSWEIGAYDETSYQNKLIFSYCTDTNFKAGTNSTSAQMTLDANGNLSINNGTDATRFITIDMRASKDAGFRITGSQYSISLMIGSGNVNRGIYDHAKGWLAYWDADSVAHFIGTVQGTRGIFTSSTDASETAGNAVALTTGSPTGTHLEMDNNEIIAKSNATTPSTLYLNGLTVLAGGILCCPNQGTGNPGSGTSGYGTTGALYFKRI